ncbi:DUF3572 domain-containing protein [uncultured Paracoccus sp.]|uniref:DUF3572 domain-containing protein n=1 Tax=uncultured Paracoccus sp. TaxID=189685 RepID=UPI0025F9D8FE|nr:DUF3572 domain-containing protein [uncultured Paracoccus sp.]
MTYTRDSAHDLAMTVLLYMVERPDLIGQFLDSSGLQPQDLRQAAGSSDIALHVLDFLLEDDRRVLEAARDLDIAPGEVMAARTALAGPGSYGWEV